MDVPDYLQNVESRNAAALFDATAAERPNEPAIDGENADFTFAELEDRSKSFAGGLRERGHEKGDRLLLYLPNCPEYVVTILGGLRAGVVVSPVNPQYKAREITHQLDDTDASVVVTHPALVEHVHEATADLDIDPDILTVGQAVDGTTAFHDVSGDPLTIDADTDTTAMQPYTSGTTGQPKGVLLTHGNLRAQAFSGFQFTNLPPEEQRELVFLPLYHITGFTHSTWQTLIRGGTAFVRNPAEWSAERCMSEIEENEITSFIGVATMFVDMVNDESFGDYDLSSLDTVNEGGAKMPVAVQERFEGETGVAMSEGYGLTETTAATHTGVGSTFGYKIGTIGQPLRMTDCKIVNGQGEEVEAGETGELLVRGPQVMKGYHDLPEATEEAFTEEGYFRTGDIARRDEENYYEIVDRKKHMINTAGYNVYPSEVEELLYEHPDVADAAVVGIPDERRNETVKAFVVKTPDADATEEDIKQFCLDNLAEYKHPRQVEFVEELPRTASGKVQKFKLVEDDE